VLDLVRRERATGRTVVLVSAAHQRVAQDVADHLDLFSQVLASVDSVPLAGRARADRLTAEFGAQGFDYVGSGRHDLPVFRSCRQATVVAPTPRVSEQLPNTSTPAVWIRSGGLLELCRGFLSAIRPKQWAKNVLVFVPVLLGHRLNDPRAVSASAATFVLLCLASSSVYLLNDILDVEADRRHHTKRRRAFAQGRVPILAGLVAGHLLAALALGLGWLLHPHVALLLLLYLAGTWLYSIWLKRLLIIDMVMLSSFYVLRVYLGASATGIRISSWTSLFCLLTFSGLAALKRYAEVHNRAAQSSDSVNRRAYTTVDAMPLLSIGTSSFVGAIIALGLYLGSPEVHLLYRSPELLWLLCPILLAWTSRLWIFGHRGGLHDEDPVALVLHDRWSHGAALLSLLVFLLAR